MSQYFYSYCLSELFFFITLFFVKFCFSTRFRNSYFLWDEDSTIPVLGDRDSVSSWGGLSYQWNQFIMRFRLTTTIFFIRWISRSMIITHRKSLNFLLMDFIRTYMRALFFSFFFSFFPQWLQTILAPVWIGIRPPVNMWIQFLELPDEGIFTFFFNFFSVMNMQRAAWTKFSDAIYVLLAEGLYLFFLSFLSPFISFYY